MAKKELVVFFSWQSDLPTATTTTLIRGCLRNASTELEVKYAKDGLHIVLDEATRDKPGSPNIPMTIMEKIAAADVFICDMTTINPMRNAPERAVPNPNVTIELGYERDSNRHFAQQKMGTRFM